MLFDKLGGEQERTNSGVGDGVDYHAHRGLIFGSGSVQARQTFPSVTSLSICISQICCQMPSISTRSSLFSFSCQSGPRGLGIPSPYETPSCNKSECIRVYTNKGDQDLICFSVDHRTSLHRLNMHSNSFHGMS